MASINFSSDGLWLLAGERKPFLSYGDFPRLKGAAAQEILNVEQPSFDHFCYPNLDIDLSENSIKHPKPYPLLAKQKGRY